MSSAFLFPSSYTFSIFSLSAYFFQFPPLLNTHLSFGEHQPNQRDDHFLLIQQPYSRLYFIFPLHLTLAHAASYFDGITGGLR